MSPARLRTRDTQEALQAVDRLLNKYHTITEDQALRAVRVLLPEEEVEEPLDFQELLGESAENAENAEKGGEAPAEEASSGS